MALTATIYNFRIELADSDREVYESLALRVARHPSESEEYLLTRVLCLRAGVHRGHRVLPGAVRAGRAGDPGPGPDRRAPIVDRDRHARRGRLHKACKVAPRVVVYTHKDPAQLIGKLAGERIHRAEALEVYAIDRGLHRELTARLERRMAFDLAVNDRDLYLSIGADTLTGPVSRYAVD